MHRQLKKQIDEATAPDGRLDSDRLLALVAETYVNMDEERRGIVRSMQLMSEEATALTREIRESTASQLQAILDNVKDAIITVGESGHIATVNGTGERVFGYSEQDLIGRGLAFLLPELPEGEPLATALDQMAARLDDTQADLAPQEAIALHANGSRFTAELAVSKAKVNRANVYIVCLRDTTERKNSEAALRESEARYRTLVQHAPECIVVLDLDEGRFVEVNDNAVRFFRMEREQLLQLGPGDVAPPLQPDGMSSVDLCKAYMERALSGEAPAFEWTLCDSFGNEIPCEVRLVRLPASNRKLIRGSIIDITERKRAELIVGGEKRVFERMAANVDLEMTLLSLVEAVERVATDSLCAIRLLDSDRATLTLSAGPKLSEDYSRAMHTVPVAIRNGSCAAAVYLERQVIVADIARDALWENRRKLALSAGLRACWSTPIRGSDGCIIGTLALYFRSPRSPSGRDFELMSRMTQLAGIAIERRRAEEALRASESQYRSLFDNVIEGVYSATCDGRFVSVNPALVRMVGCESAAELLAIPTSELYADPDVRSEILAALELDGEVRNAEFRLRRLDGTTLTVVENARAVRGKDGQVVGFEGTVSDITERKRAETQVIEEKEKAQTTLRSIGDAVITTDAEGRVDYANAIAEELTGWTLAEAHGRPLVEVFSLLNEATRDALEHPVLRCIREGQVIKPVEQAVLVNRKGQEIAIQDSAAPIRDRSGKVIGAVMVFHDVSKERRLQRALTYQATHDALTGLINRREFERRVQEALLQARSGTDVTHVMLYLDLDQFKVVNDTCGHQAGDLLLKQITGLLQTRVRVTDTIARLGGDEFGILLLDCSMDWAAKLAENLRQAIRDFRFVWQDGAMNVGVSVGIVEINRDSESIASILSASDVACYAAKDSGRNRVHMYEHGTAPERHREMQWVSRLTRACEENRLELYYQPIVAIGRNPDKRGHYELLLRMRGENGALVSPAEFIPAAERYNLMPAIDRWVVRHALGALAHYRSDGPPDGGYTLSINLSGTSLNDDRFLEFMINELQSYDLSPGSVCFEITETAAIANLANVVHFMKELRERGCLFSLDDFGSGLSSFLYLKNLPVDYLKIDGQFIQNVTTDHVDRAMVEAIAQIGRAMGLKTVAERVESAEVLACLGEIGIDYAQGWFLAPPESVESLNRITCSTTDVRFVRSA